MRQQTDLLLGSILLTIPLAVLSPSARTTGSFAGSGALFSESFLLTKLHTPLEPSPEIYKEMWGADRRVVYGQYTVKPKDALEDVAKRFGTNADYIRSTNQLQSPHISPGKTLIVHNGNGMLLQVREKNGRAETLQEIARRFGRTSEKDMKEIVQDNRLPGVALLTSDWLQPGSLLFVPKAKLRFADYVLPVDFLQGKWRISSGFGMRRHPILGYRKFHSGLDLARPYGFPVKASRDGVVIFADWRGGYGRLIIVKHAGGLRTWYGHLSSIKVSPGDRVRAGQMIGRVGSTGLSTGPHLHFEVRDRYGNSLNPKKYLF